MNKIYFFLFILIPLISCNDEDSGLMFNGINTQFKLYDNNGVEKTIFKSGEDFEMRFYLINLSGRDLSYHYTGIPVTFEIHQNDSIVVTSVDGLSFAQVILGAEIKNGETYKANWLAPNSPARDPKISLPAGNYKAFVKHYGFFDKIQIKETSPIEFVITN
ncbi:MAG: hypothetical protein MUP85_10680 [Candidatus Lokiarchaeota archaeon]|nr:hypothetical protein [Candidatus Lokiarchaeota archaeon]